MWAQFQCIFSAVSTLIDMVLSQLAATNDGHIQKYRGLIDLPVEGGGVGRRRPEETGGGRRRQESSSVWQQSRSKSRSTLDSIKVRRIRFLWKPVSCHPLDKTRPPALSLGGKQHGTTSHHVVANVTQSIKYATTDSPRGLSLSLSLFLSPPPFLLFLYCSYYVYRVVIDTTNEDSSLVIDCSSSQSRILINRHNMSRSVHMVSHRHEILYHTSFDSK